MKGVWDTLITIVVVGAVLIIPWLLTNVLVQKMYYRCAGCGTLNAKRRRNCRVCNHELP